MANGEVMADSYVIAGRYVQACRLAHGLRSSANKTVHRFTDCDTLEDLERVPPAEVSIDAAGNLAISSIDLPSMAKTPHV